MMHSNEQIREAVAALPPEFQEAIADASISNKVLEIGNRHALHVDQVGKLQDNAMLAALGLIDGDTFGKTIASDLAIPSDKALAIVRDVNAEVFESIRAAVKERVAKEAEEIEEETAAAEAPRDASIPAKSEEAIDREALLKEIERPTPAALPPMAPPPPATPAVEMTPAAASPAPAPQPPTEKKPPFVSSEYKVFNAAPEQAAAPAVPSYVPPHLPQNLPIGNPVFAAPPAAVAPEGTVAGQKLAAPAVAPTAETTHKDTLPTFSKKVDPYREPIE